MHVTAFDFLSKTVIAKSVVDIGGFKLDEESKRIVSVLNECAIGFDGLLELACEGVGITGGFLRGSVTSLPASS